MTFSGPVGISVFAYTNSNHVSAIWKWTEINPLLFSQAYGSTANFATRTSNIKRGAIYTLHLI